MLVQPADTGAGLIYDDIANGIDGLSNIPNAGVTRPISVVLPYEFNGTSWDKIRGLIALDGVAASSGTGALGAGILRIDSLLGKIIADYNVNGVNASVSATNAANPLTVDLRGLHDHLSITSSASAGTFTLTVAGSVDNSTFTTLVSMAANAGPQTLDFVGSAPLSSTNPIAPTDVSNPVSSGGAVTINVPLNPLAFRYVKITAGTAGVGNTTTTTITAK